MAHSARSAGIDLVRVIGILAVIVGHVWSVEPVSRVVSPWHVPIFFFLTGWFWTAGRSLGSEVRGRWRALGRPYLAWFLVIGLAWYPAQIADGVHDPLELLRPFLGGQYIGRPYTAFWFVTALAVAAVALRFLERFPVWVRWVVVTAAVAVATTAPGVLRLPPESAGTAFAMLLFVLAGTVARQWLPRVRRPALVGIVCLFGGGTAVVLDSEPPVFKQADFGTPLVGALTAIVLCSGLVLVGLALDRVVRGRIAAIVSRLASVGITVVLLHAAVIWVAVPVLPAPAVFVVATVVPWTIALLLDRTRFAPWATGRTPSSSTDRPAVAQPALVQP
ncbi:acyltransferase family protein [Curtobacterium sp. A7_M15]|uniref:acyltransferase family protein n=1 Tax=Curtobacterium sp. A7_M15 TaxID=3065241 RepID=UPI002737B054|nr:acyltransferase family protein [Curtobacterium sp. A7_M15]MDP4333092.1 acyltransferase family protein [Curtobacterium sp. A7_M15]